MNERRARYMGIYAYHGLEKRQVAASGIEFNGRTNKSKASNVDGVFSYLLRKRLAKRVF